MSIVNELGERGFTTSFTLTDLYPSASAPHLRAVAASSIRYWPSPVDAARVPVTLTGIRTMFASFHHFRPEAARGILADAFHQRRPICIFEVTSWTLAAIASTLLIPLIVLFLTPRIKSVSWSQIVFTYAVPILPLLISGTVWSLTCGPIRARS